MASGMITKKVEPTPGVLWTPTSPPSSSGEAFAQRQPEPGAAQAFLQRRVDLGEVFKQCAM